MRTRKCTPQNKNYGTRIINGENIFVCTPEEKVSDGEAGDDINEDAAVEGHVNEHQEVSVGRFNPKQNCYRESCWTPSAVGGD
ncbi:hypothetical protein U1Q18_024957 [Sarracenia purpurea var. burkii]